MNDGGPAFPVMVNQVEMTGSEVAIEHSGMSLRDWFAGQVLTLSAVAMMNHIVAAAVNGHMISEEDLEKYAVDKTAKDAYLYADAMIERRKI